MIMESYRTFKCRSINNTTGSNFLQHQQVLIACHQIMGTSLYGKCQKVIVSFVSAKLYSLSGFKWLTNNLQKLNQRFNIFSWEIFGKFWTSRNLLDFSKQLTTDNQLNALVTQQIDEFGESPTYQKTDPAVSINYDVQFRLSWHNAHVLQPLLQPRYLLQRFRLYETSQGIGSAPCEWSCASRLYLYAVANVWASAGGAIGLDCN